MINDYEFVTTWRVAGTVDEVMAILGDAESLSRWWPSVYLNVVLRDSGTPRGVGRVADLNTKGWLPYTLRWTLTITEPITTSGFALRADGDLRGTGRWTFEQDGPEAVTTYDWRVSVTKPLLRRLSWLLKPFFAANHHWAMARGEESLRLELRRRRAANEVERAPGCLLRPDPLSTRCADWCIPHPLFEVMTPNPPGRHVMIGIAFDPTGQPDGGVRTPRRMIFVPYADQKMTCCATPRSWCTA